MDGAPMPDPGRWRLDGLWGMTALALYTGLTWALAPAVRLYLRRRVAAGKEDAARIEERFGRPSRARPDGPLVWVHGASVGEANSMLPLVDRLIASDPKLHVLMTTGTVASARLLANRLPARAIHQFVPVDLPFAVKGFLEHWRPDLVLWTESEFWPNLLTRISEVGAPLILVNGRVSKRSFAGWRRMRPLIRQILRGFSLCLAQGPEDERHLRDLGGGLVRSAGNLKFAVPALPADAGDLDALDKALGGRPRWLAASTHPGEETMAAEAHRAMASAHPGLLTMIVPRHATRGPEIAQDLRTAGFRVALRSAGEMPGTDVEIFVADTMGELGLWYRLAPIALVGGRWCPTAGKIRSSRRSSDVPCWSAHMSIILRISRTRWPAAVRSGGSPDLPSWQVPYRP